MADSPNDVTVSFWQCLRRSAGMSESDRRNYALFMRWGAAWVICLLVGGLGVKHAWVPTGALTWLTAAAPDVFLLGMMYRYYVFVRSADELVQRIQLHGLAAGFALGFAATAGTLVLEKAGAPPLSVNDVFVYLVGGWSIGIALASWRYR